MARRCEILYVLGMHLDHDVVIARKGALAPRPSRGMRLGRPGVSMRMSHRCCGRGRLGHRGWEDQCGVASIDASQGLAEFRWTGA